MARKNVLTPVKLNSAKSLATSFTTAPTMVTFTDNIAYQINITTTNSIGPFVVQGSVDYQVDAPTGAVTNTGNWVDLTLSGSPAANASNDQILININQFPFNAIRLSYTASTPGTGTCDIYIMTKEIGG